MGVHYVNYSASDAMLRTSAVKERLTMYPEHEHHYLVQDLEREDIDEVAGDRLIDVLGYGLLIELACGDYGTWLINATNCQKQSDEYAPRLDPRAYLFVALALVRALIDAEFVDQELGYGVCNAFELTFEANGYPPMLEVEKVQDEVANWHALTRWGSRERKVASALRYAMACLSDGGNIGDLGRAIRDTRNAITFDEDAISYGGWVTIRARAYEEWCRGVVLSQDIERRGLCVKRAVA